jgi:hypothetical protein
VTTKDYRDHYFFAVRLHSRSATSPTRDSMIGRWFGRQKIFSDNNVLSSPPFLLVRYGCSAQPVKQLTQSQGAFGLAVNQGRETALIVTE